jgi:RhtB (resistance to homoserine/threonine) family protein
VTLDAQFVAGLLVLALLTISPGADMALVAKITLERGRRAALIATLGICSGLFVHAIASALGLSVILATSAEAFTIVKLVGAAYLAYLGVQALRSSFRHATAEALPPRRATTPFFEGLLSNVLNPKVAVFYLTFMPQFMSPSDNVLARSVAFAVAHSIMGVVWLTAYAYVLSRIGVLLGRSGVQRWLERVTGGVLIALGARLALERR